MIARRGNGRGLELAGIAAAVVLAVVVNVLAARHFARWDWTEGKRWSISDATLETLRGLERPVDLWMVVGRADPIEGGLRQLAGAYEAGSKLVVVHWVDPDRDAAQLVDMQRRFGLDAGRAEDGRVDTDAVVIASSGDKHWFLTHQDLFEAAEDDLHVRPREERALTRAIRSVLGGEKASEKPRLCFTIGHGELSLDARSDERDSLGGVRDLLEKDNYALVSVDAAVPDAHEPFAGCAVAVLAGPRAPFTPAEADRLRAYLLQGGNLLAVVGPADAVDGTEPPAGLDPAIGPFGIGLDDVVVHDVDPEVSIPDTHGEGFFVTPRAHPVTAALIPGSEDARPPRVAAFFARSLRHVSTPGAAAASDLLITTDGAYAKTSLAGAAGWTGAPPRDPGDRGGPFVLAMAAERPAAASSPHGPRVVVIGSRFALAEENWKQPRPLHGAAFFIDSALSWLASRPEVVDVPDRAEVAVAMRLSEEGRAEVRRYVLVLMPLAVLLLGVAVWAWRRSSENAPYVPVGPPRGDEDADDRGRPS